MLPYTCQYLYNNGSLCNRPCHRAEGCWEYWRSKKRIPCICDKPTAAAPKACKKHAGDFYIKQFNARQLSKNTTSELEKKKGKKHIKVHQR